MPIIAFQCEYLTLLDKNGKPLGTDAALFLSQIAWLSVNCADTDGWFVWTQAKCTEETGLTRFQQEQIRRRLTEAGYMKEDRRGVDGRLHFSVCEKLTNRNPEKPSECEKLANRNEKGMRETDKPESEVREGTARNSQTETDPVCEFLANRFARNSQTAFSLKETKTLSESPPYIVPPKSGEKPGRKPKETFVPPTAGEVQSFVIGECGGSMADAENFFDHFTSNGWLVSGKAPMRDWKAAARKWVRQSVKWEKTDVRGSPAKNGHSPPVPKTRAQTEAEEWEALERISQKGGFSFGR